MLPLRLHRHILPRWRCRGILNCSKSVASSAVWWNHVVQLLLSNLHFISIVKEPRLLSCFILSIIKSTRLCSLCVVSDGCACSDSSHMRSIAILPLDWLLYRLVQINHQIIVDSVFIWRFRISCCRWLAGASGLSSSLIRSDSFMCLRILLFSGVLCCIIIN